MKRTYQIKLFTQILIIKLLFFVIVNNIHANTASISVHDLVEFSRLPNSKKNLISYALNLSSKGYPYKFGKSSPSEGGFDCSGAVFHTLKVGQISGVPRTASAQYKWIWNNSGITPVTSHKLSSFEFSKLRPCDLLFWTGTYKVDRDPPISHVMIYLGTLKKNGKKVMIGASNGRRYEGRSRNGFSVFDFTIPKPNVNKSTRFIGYGEIPNVLRYKSPKYTYNRKSNIKNKSNYPSSNYRAQRYYNMASNRFIYNNQINYNSYKPANNYNLNRPQHIKQPNSILSNQNTYFNRNLKRLSDLFFR